MERVVVVRTQFEGIHSWPEAPEEVKFLRNPHRHTFNVEVEIEVRNDDRDIEFIMMKRKINNLLLDHLCHDGMLDENGVWLMGRTSCEQAAAIIISVVQEVLDDDERKITCYVDEDGENGAKVFYKSETNDQKVNKAKPSMSLTEYQTSAYKNIQEHDSHQEEVMHWAIGLGEEAGETLSVIKHRYYGGGYNLADLIEELGDTLWHIAALCTSMGIELEDVAEFNLAKLNHRYPSGEFDYNRSKNRKQLGSEFKDSDECKTIMKRIEASRGWEKSRGVSDEEF